MRVSVVLLTESALEILTEQIYTVWKQGGDKVASLLSSDVASAFPTTSHGRMIHNLKMKGIPTWMTNWINNLLIDTLATNGRAVGRFPMAAGLPQGSPLSSTLYLFYNADLQLLAIVKVNEPRQWDLPMT